MAIGAYMIIIIEGCRGTGKTTLCAALARQLKAPIIRPFRPDVGHHHTGASAVEEALKAMGVPVNTHVDDLYVADILASIAAVRPDDHFILDRSMGSAVAHRTCPQDDTAVVALWQSLLLRTSAVRYVWLRAAHAVAAKRVAGGRPIESAVEYGRLDRGFARVYEAFNGEKMKLVTTDISADGVAAQVSRWLHGGARALAG